MSEKYKNVFKSILIEDDQIRPEDITAEGDAEALDSSFEGDLRADDFETDPIETGLEDGQVPDETIEKTKEAITKIKEFSEWLNSTESNSLNKQLNDLDKEGSIYRGVAGNSGQIVSAAKALNDIVETLTGVVLSAPKKQRELQQQNITQVDV